MHFARMLLLFVVSVTPCLSAPQRGLGNLVVQHRALMREAIAAGNVERVNKLLQTPYVDINDPEVNYLALALGAPNNHRQLIQCLLDEGVNVQRVTPDNRTILHMIVANRKAVDDFALVMSVLRDELSSEELREFVNIRDNYGNGNTALWYIGTQVVNDASEPNLLFFAKQLITAGAAPNSSPNGAGITSFAYLKDHFPGYTKLIQYMAEHGARER